MSDYLKYGGISNDTFVPRSPPAATSREELYLTNYGRQWGDKLTYSTGVAYGAGLGLGGTYGIMQGIRKGGATRKLRTNAILNGASTRGPALANKWAVITIFYCGMTKLLSLSPITADERVNVPLAGALSGALYQAAGSWRARGLYGAAAAAVYSSLAWASKYDYI